VAELTTDYDADQGPVGLPTRKGATRTLPPSFPSARSSRALDGDDNDEAERRHGARGDPATGTLALHETPALRDSDETDGGDEPDAEELFWRRVDDEYQRWKEEGRP
jgi:hypothetical protein